MSDKYLTADEVRNIPESDLPLAVLCFNFRSFFSAGINIVKRGIYNHFMWMVRPGYFATQDWWFREVPVDKYMTNHRLKLVQPVNWNQEQKALVSARVIHELSKPAWKTRYDVVAIFGQLVGIAGIQTPWTKICSDHALYIKLADKRMDLEYPAPSDVNSWFKKYPEDYTVYGRFEND